MRVIIIAIIAVAILHCGLGSGESVNCDETYKDHTSLEYMQCACPSQVIAGKELQINWKISPTSSCPQQDLSDTNHKIGTSTRIFDKNFSGCNLTEPVDLGEVPDTASSKCQGTCTEVVFFNLDSNYSATGLTIQASCRYICSGHPDCTANVKGTINF